MTRLTSEVDSLPGIVERKIVSIGLTKLLTETQEMHSTYVDLWPAVVSCLVKIFEVRATNEGDEENQLADLESKGYQAAFAKLAYSARQDHDPFADIANPQQYVQFSRHILVSNMGDNNNTADSVCASFLAAFGGFGAIEQGLAHPGTIPLFAFDFILTASFSYCVALHFKVFLAAACCGGAADAGAAWATHRLHRPTGSAVRAEVHAGIGHRGPPVSDSGGRVFLFGKSEENWQ